MSCASIQEHSGPVRQSVLAKVYPTGRQRRSLAHRLEREVIVVAFPGRMGLWGRRAVLD